MPPTPQLPVRLNPVLVRQLDKVAAAKGVTRSELVRQGIELILARPDANEILNRAAVEGMMRAGLEHAKQHDGPLPAPRTQPAGTLAEGIAAATAEMADTKPLRPRAQRRKAPH